MKSRHVVASILVCVGVSLSTRTPALGQEHPLALLERAKGMYESAEYDSALTALDGMDPAGITPDLARDKAVYETLCLLALDRKGEAEARIEKVVQEEPLFRPTPDMPPRFLAAIEEVRTRLRPSLVERHYLSGKELFDNEDYAAALNEFTLVVALMEDVRDQGEPSLRDVRTLAAGFRDLSRRALSATSSSVATSDSQAPAAPEIVPPVTLHQKLPALPAAMSAKLEQQGPLLGMLEITVNEQGDVASTRLVKPIHPLYDVLLLSQAGRWKYRPATRNGAPIQYVKRLTVTVKAQ
jgi:hypothetical protein